jgi:hypothetical protein
MSRSSCTPAAAVCRLTTLMAAPEAGGWSVFIPGLPIAADGPTFDAAIDEMVQALREYAEDWQDRLLDVSNHRDNWGLVQLVRMCDDDQLREWLAGSARRTVK